MEKSGKSEIRLAVGASQKGSIMAMQDDGADPACLPSW